MTFLLPSAFLLPSMMSLLLAGTGAPPWVTRLLNQTRIDCPIGTSPVRGLPNAPVTIIEFTDYDCPACVRSEPVVQEVLTAYPAQVRLVFKNLPLEFHTKARGKAVIAECSGEQGVFWEAHDRFFRISDRDRHPVTLDAARMRACVERGGNGQIDQDIALARRLRIPATPSFLINGLLVKGGMPFASFKLVIDAELARLRSGSGSGP